MNRFDITFVSLSALLMGSTLMVVGTAFALTPYFPWITRALLLCMPTPTGGGLLAALGLLLLGAFYSLNKRRFLRFRTAHYTLSEEALAQLAEHCLRTRYPHTICHASVKRGRELTLTADLAAHEEELPHIEALVQRALFESCGFTGSISLYLLKP